ncbi:ERMES complex subunit [Geranomyces variabilis]|uniref:Mitochondrial distribution and morphology protein 34 n=1 Tax=Geranomyces variabilis TaxID=109894 RepID=A0AAD5XRJ7_9FUNG|nr:ERMES complex subunit [Geranomyces variabilis]
MSFKLNWPAFSTEFLEKAKAQLNAALNKGTDSRPSNIVGDILVHSLNMGTKPPDLEILEIGELQEERFRGIFKMAYTGDAHLELVTKVQANPLHTPRMSLAINGGRDGVLAANWPLVVPMRLKISNLVLRGIIVLVVDKHKGVTLVFKNDPLEKVDVNSTFDNIPNIRRFLQLQIETQLRKMFQEDLPALIHNLSLVYFRSQAEAAGGRSTSSPTQMTDSGVHVPLYDGTDLAPKRPEVHKSMRDRWLGNDAIDCDEDDDAWVHGYMFYRNLSEICQALDLGLKNLAIPRPFLSNNAVCRSWMVDRLQGSPRETLEQRRRQINSQQRIRHSHQLKTSSRSSTSSSVRSTDTYSASSRRPSAPSSGGYGGYAAPSLCSTESSGRSRKFRSEDAISTGYSHYRRCTTRPRIPALAQKFSLFRIDFEEECQKAFHSVSLTAVNPNLRPHAPGWSNHSQHAARADSAGNPSAITPPSSHDEDEPFNFDAPLDIFALNPPPSTPAAALAAAAECMQVPSPVTLLPSDNPRAAHLANLMDANRSLAVNTPSEEIRHWAFRAHPIRFLSLMLSSSTIESATLGDKEDSVATSAQPDSGGTAKNTRKGRRPPAYSHHDPHPCTRSTFVVTPAPSRRRRNNRRGGSNSPSHSPVRTPHFAPLPTIPTHTSSFSGGHHHAANPRPGSTLATRNITKLTLPAGVSVPAHLLSPGLDQRFAEMGYHLHPA